MDQKFRSNAISNKQAEIVEVKQVRWKKDKKIWEDKQDKISSLMCLYYKCMIDMCSLLMVKKVIILLNISRIMW
jgi:hypothetical protein